MQIKDLNTQPSQRLEGNLSPWLLYPSVFLLKTRFRSVGVHLWLSWPGCCPSLLCAIPTCRKGSTKPPCPQTLTWAGLEPVGAVKRSGEVASNSPGACPSWRPFGLARQPFSRTRPKSSAAVGARVNPALPRQPRQAAGSCSFPPSSPVLAALPPGEAGLSFPEALSVFELLLDCVSGCISVL